MKARIEKKLSKKLVALAPKLFKDAWVDNYEPSELAYEQGTSVSGVLSLGGGTDYWGEAEEHYTCWMWLQINWCWLGYFPTYPEGHELEIYPDTRGFKPTTRNLLKLVKEVSSKL